MSEAFLPRTNRVEFGWVGFLVVCFLYKTNPNPRKKVFTAGKSGPNATLNPILLGLGWPWAGALVGFMTRFTWCMFSNPTEF